MEDKKNKKKTLTISKSFSKKVNPASLPQQGKKSFSIDKKNHLNLKREKTSVQILTLLTDLFQAKKRILQENLLNNKQKKILLKKTISHRKKAN